MDLLDFDLDFQISIYNICVFIFLIKKPCNFVKILIAQYICLFFLLKQANKYLFIRKVKYFLTFF